MGSGHSKSSQVQAVNIEPEDRPSSSSGSVRRSLSRNTKVENGDINNENKSKLLEAQQKIAELEKQLAETDSENLDLQDRVQGLECQLDHAARLQTVQEEAEDFTETLKAKDQYTATVEKEKAALQTELTKMKNRYRKRIKTLMRQVGEAKQEQSIQMFELRDEITRLREENNKTRDAMHGSSSKTNIADVEEPMGANKMKIVLELSNQVSEQEEQISKLEHENKEKQLIIDQLLLESKSVSKSRQFSSLSDKPLETEKQIEEKVSLRKLSAGLGQYKKPPTSERNDRNVEEERNYSGSSRDSGLGYAGQTVDIPPKLSKGMSKLSVLSDSDWDSDEPLSVMSKVKSAPAEMQGKRTASRCSSVYSNKTTDDDRVSVDDNISISSTSKKHKKLSFLQRRFRPEGGGGGEGEMSPAPNMNAFEKEASCTIENQHFFLTQGDSTVSPVGEPDSIPVY